MIEPMSVDPGAESHDRYIGGLICYGRRGLYDSERDFLVAMTKAHRKYARGYGFVAIVSLAALVVSFLLAGIGRSDAALILGMFALLFGVPSAWMALRSRSRRRLIEQELQVGWVEAYGEPPVWNKMGGVPEHTERLIYVPATRRVIWIDGQFREDLYDSPTTVAKPPDAYHQLAASEWFDEERPAFRELQPVEIEELRRHLANRRYQALLGLLGLGLLLALGIVIPLTKNFPPGGIFIGVFSVMLIPVGWRAWRQFLELRRCLESGRVGMIKQRTEDGFVVVEFLEGNGVIWTVAGAAHPWRGVRGAR